MGLFGALAGVAIGRNKGSQSDTSKPFHTHTSKSNNQNAGAAPVPVEKPQTYEPRSDGSGQQAPIFMGAKQVDSFQNISPDPLSVDRGGRTVPRPDGMEPELNLPAPPAPELGQVPVPPPDIDQQGVKSLYSQQ
tara:strand:+ start:103 stop:504 length:402 start_codon:yes stop_codon:yes gene_type:complete